MVMPECPTSRDASSTWDVPRLYSPCQLPGALSVCYKPYMRKWMSDRLKRRKKAKDKESKPTEPAQAPLQPSYFGSETAPAEAARAPEPEPEVSDDLGLIEAPEPEQAAVAGDTTSPSGARQGGQRPRRRRT